MQPSSSEFTELLMRWNDGDAAALDQLVMAMASRVVRRLLVDHARARRAGTRGGDLPHVELADDIGLTNENASWVADLNEAPQALEAVDVRVARAWLAMRFVEETSAP